MSPAHALALGLVLAGCAPRLGVPPTTYGAPQPIHLVRMEADARWYVPIEVEGHGVWVFFLDSGYSYTTCDDDLVAALDLPTGGRSVVRGELGSLRVPRARLPTLQLGGHQQDGLVCQVRDLNTTSSVRDPADGARIGGVLGIDVLRPFRVTTDPSTGTVLLEPPDQPPLAGEGVVPLRREHRVGVRAVVPLEVGERTVWPVLDTGAAGTHLNGERLGLAPARVREGVVVRGTGGTGMATRTVRAYRASARLGEVDLSPLSFTGRSRIGGLLGLNVLGRHRVTWDFQRREALFEPVRPARLPVFSAESPLAGRIGPPAKTP